MRVRQPAVAGLFYPADEHELRAALAEYCSVECGSDARPTPKALIAPHAGYVYSGPIAGHAYSAAHTLAGRVERVVLLGPAHRVPVDGLAVPTVDAFLTPLGPAVIDSDARAVALECAGVVADDLAHAPEHSLEVQLPFLQHALGTDVRVLPLVVGRASAETVAGVLDALWGGAETLIVVSSDLSHYETYAAAREHDRRTARAIVDRALDHIGPYDACGAYPIRGLLAATGAEPLDGHCLDLRNSGDTAGARDRVVGYGAFTFDAPATVAA